MSDEVPKSDADDVLRVIRGGDAPARDAAQAPGTFLLTSVHRIGEDAGPADRRGPDAEDRASPREAAASDTGDSGEDRPSTATPIRRLRSVPDGDAPTAFRRPPPWKDRPGDPRAEQDGGADRRRDSGPAVGAAAQQKGADAVPGLEDPTGMEGAPRGPLPNDPRREASDTLMPDEAALRRLVEDVLEERLSGELGQRITRNVRALVHREVARALRDRDD